MTSDRMLAGSAGAGPCTTKSPMRSCTQRTATARSAARRPARRSSRSPGSRRRSSTITDGFDDLAIFGEEHLNDTRCAACGSFLYSVVRNGAYVHVALGSLVDAPTIRPTEHIFVGSKAPWFEITDDLPQHDEY